MASDPQANEGQPKSKAKTKEELEAEQQAAKEQLQAILDNTRWEHDMGRPKIVQVVPLTLWLTWSLMMRYHHSVSAILVRNIWVMELPLE